MKREDVLKVDELKEELTTAFRAFERSLRTVFGELVYGIDGVVERYNALEAKQAQLHDEYASLKASHADMATTLATVSDRLLALERTRGDAH